MWDSWRTRNHQGQNKTSFFQELSPNAFSFMKNSRMLSSFLLGWDRAEGRHWEQEIEGRCSLMGCGHGSPDQGALCRLLTDMPGGDPQGLDHQGLLPSFRDAIQNPALGREFGKVLICPTLSLVQFHSRFPPF